MKLKPQPRPGRPAARQKRHARAHARGVVHRARGAQRPGVPLRRRIAATLPSLARATAVLAAAASTAALVGLLNGPWLRATDITFGGQRQTASSELERLLGDLRGTSLLAIETRAAAERIERLPAVAEADVRATLLGRVEATIVEHEVALVWQTRSSRFLGAADGTIFAAVPDGEALPSELAALPQIRDERFAARLVSVGDVIPGAIVRTALDLLKVDPAALGSASSHVTLRLDDEYGFRLASAAPSWEIALGAYGIDPSETAAEAAARLERQVAAVRTLFAERPEGEIAWVDVRNPGKVYFRAKG